MGVIIIIAIVIIIIIWLTSGGQPKSRKVICPRCNGSGCSYCGNRGRIEQTWDECPHCNGSGSVTVRRRYPATADRDCYVEEERDTCPECEGQGKTWVPGKI